MEPGLGFLQKTSAEPDQNAGEGFALYEPGVIVVQRFECEGVGSVEQAGDAESPEPRQPAVGFDGGDLGGEGHRLDAGGFGPHSEFRSGGERAVEPTDEGIPLRVILCGGKDAPDPVGGGVEVNGRAEGTHVNHRFFVVEDSPRTSSAAMNTTTARTINTSLRRTPG